MYIGIGMKDGDTDGERETEGGTEREIETQVKDLLASGVPPKGKYFIRYCSSAAKKVTYHTGIPNDVCFRLPINRLCRPVHKQKNQDIPTYPSSV